MNLTLKIAVSAALVGLAAAAQAQITPVAIPPMFPTDGSMAGANTTGGAMLVQAFDPITGASLTEYTGLHWSDILPATADDSSYVADFGIIGGATLWNQTFGSDTNPIDFMVTAANNAVSGSGSVLVTLANPPPPPSFSNATVTNAAAKFNTAVGYLGSNPPQQSNASQAAGANPSQTFLTSDNGYVAVTALGGTYGGTFGPNSVTAGVVGGTGVGFYDISQVPGTVHTAASVVQYANANGNLIVNVASNGDFTITAPGGTPVPVPAAVWLLGSGLLGLAGIGRRRAAANA